MKSKVSIVIAIYNCEKYIEICARSLFEQTLNEIEFIFVNDATPDNSVKILENIIKEYPHRQPYIKIINLDKNKGVSHARQVGISNATGEYIIHTDSDDWIDNDMYERLYHCAKTTNADIVGCNFRHEFSDVQYDFLQPYTNNKEENIRRLIIGQIFPSLCTSLTRRSLIDNNNLNFPIGLNMGEDLFFNLQLYLYSNIFASLNWAPYHYRHTEDSSCIKRTRKSIDSDIAIAGLIEKKLKELGLYQNYINEIEYRKFYSKLPLMLDLNNEESYKTWLNIYPETNSRIWRYKMIDWKQRLILWFAAHHMLSVAKVFQRFLELQHKVRRL